MKTATEMLADQDEARDETILNQRIAHFVKSYAPEDPYDNRDFQVALHSIVRATYAEATKPYEKIWQAYIYSQPFPIKFVYKP